MQATTDSSGTSCVLASPTQHFPTKPKPFDRQSMTADDVIDFTPELKAEALKVLSQYRLGSMFAPTALFDPEDPLKETIRLPAASGGANWQGAAADPETGILYVPSVTQPSVVPKVNEGPRGGDDRNQALSDRRFELVPSVDGEREQQVAGHAVRPVARLDE
jgi:quinoprotein glucose dehydrogenase